MKSAHFKPLFAAACILASAIVSAQPSLSDGLVAHYPLNGNPYDESGNANHGVNNGATWGADRFGRPSQCAIFGAALTARITVAGARIPAGGADRTISLWYLPAVPPDLNGKNYAFLSYGDNGVSGTSQQGKHLWVTLINRQLAFMTPYNGYSWTGDRGHAVWRHVVVTIKNGVVRAFDNGASLGIWVPPAPNIPIDTNPNTDLIIGGYRTDGFPGAIDDVRIYDRALADTEVAALYALESAAPPLTARASPTVLNGSVTSVAVLDAGAGYVEAPLVILTGGSGTGATATALVANGGVSQILVQNGGSGYDSPPAVIVDSPRGRPPTLAIEMLGALPFIAVTGFPGDTNRIEVATSVGSGAVWTTLTNMVLAGELHQFLDRSSPLGSTRFYRSELIGRARPTPAERFVWLPPGRFVMGSPTSEPGRNADEVLTVATLSRGFFMGRYEVTQGEWLDVMGSNPSWYVGDITRPVEQVSWQDATNFCAVLTQRERSAGRLPSTWEYRLPTEAEWEYAARAGTSTRFSHGDDLDYSQLGDHAWFLSNSEARTHTVGLKKANAWGLHDISGNLLEWCSDWNAGALPGGSVIDPWGPTSGSQKVARGGTWSVDGRSCRAAHRAAYPPDFGSYYIGFRLVLAEIP